MLRFFTWFVAAVLFALLAFFYASGRFVPAVNRALESAFALGLIVLVVLILFAPGVFGRAAGRWNGFWRRIGSRRREREELERKIAQLDKPHHMEQLGTLYLAQGQFRKAGQWFEKALERDGQAVTACYKLGVCRFELGEFAAAAELLERVHVEKPQHDYGMAYLRLAQSQHKSGNAIRASEVYETLLKFYPNHPEGTFHYALLLAEHGDPFRAKKLMQDVIVAVRLSPSFQRRRNRHWSLKARWWLFRNGKNTELANTTTETRRHGEEREELETARDEKKSEH